MPSQNDQVANTWVRSIGPPAVRMRTMSKLAKVTISENSAVMAMMLRIIGKVTYHKRCHQLAPSIAARYMIMKNGEPIQTLTRITEKRAQLASPVQCTGSMPTRARIQLNALYE